MGRVRGLAFSSVVLAALAAAGQNPPATLRQAKRETLFRATNIAVKPELPNAPSYQPLTPRQKFRRFIREARSPYVFGEAAVTSATWELRNHSPFGGGSVGFAEGYGAAFAQREASLFLSQYAIPSILHQYPRYFPPAAGSSTFHRAAYAASRVFMTRADDGGQTWNASYIMGNLATAGIASLYIRHRDAGTIFSDFAVGMGTDAGYNILKEFWPAMRKRIPGKRTKQLGDLVIGSRKPESSPPPSRN